MAFDSIVLFRTDLITARTILLEVSIRCDLLVASIFNDTVYTLNPHLHVLYLDCLDLHTLLWAGILDLSV